MYKLAVAHGHSAALPAAYLEVLVSSSSACIEGVCSLALAWLFLIL